MTALATGRLMPDVKQFHNIFGGYLLDYVILDTEIIYKGAFVELLATGEVQAANIGASLQVVGIATETVDNTDDGLSVTLLVGALIEHAVVGGVIGSIGDAIFCTDDNILTITDSTGDAVAGWYVAQTGTAQGLVQMTMPGVPAS